MNTLIKSSRIVTAGSIVNGYVLMENGKIVAVSTQPVAGDHQLIDAGDNVVMPGIIDPHVHINEPGRTSWEGFDTATRAAIAGGITTLVDMPLNSSPVTTSVAAFNEKLAATNGKLHCNVGFWGGLIPGNSHEIEPLIKHGVLGFKAFLTHSGIDDFPNVSRADLELAMPIIAKHNLPLLVHCELTDNTDRWPGDKRSYKNYLASRPKFWEDEAVAMMIELCRQFNCRVHIVHLSSANSIQQIEAAKNQGLPITVETGQHYLFFNAEEIEDGRTEFKCAPPIREAKNNEMLWQALQSGIIDFVATDHSPSTPDLKELSSGDFSKAWGGIASVQFALPALWTAAKKHGIQPSLMAKWLSQEPSKLAGLSSSKGKIAPGYDADIVVWNPEKSFVVEEKDILHKNKPTPYLNQQLFGVVDSTFLKGKCVYQNGAVTIAGSGQLIMNL